MGGTKELAVWSQHDPRSHLLASLNGKTMLGQPPAQCAAGGRVGASGADIFADKGEVDAGPFRRLMLGAGEGGGGVFSLPQIGGKLVGHVGLAFRTQDGEDGQVMRPGDDGMAEQNFGLAGDLFMPGVVESRGQNLPRRGIRLRHHNMPVLVGNPCHGAGLGVLHDEERGGIKTELGPEHGDHLAELPAIQFHLRRYDEMPNGIGATEPAGIGHGILEVRNRALHDLHRLVVLGIGQVPGQCAGSSGSPDARGLDQHGQRPSIVLASARACARSSALP